MVTREFSILQWSAMQIGPSPTFHFMEWRHSWTFSGPRMSIADVWFMFCSSLSKELVHFCAVKYFWLDLVWEKGLSNNGNYRECLQFMGVILRLSNGNSRWGALSDTDCCVPAALVLSRLDYCNSMLGGLPAVSIRLKMLQHGVGYASPRRHLPVF